MYGDNFIADTAWKSIITKLVTSQEDKAYFCYYVIQYPLHGFGRFACLWFMQVLSATQNVSPLNTELQRMWMEAVVA